MSSVQQKTPLGGPSPCGTILKHISQLGKYINKKISNDNRCAHSREGSRPTNPYPRSLGGNKIGISTRAKAHATTIVIDGSKGETKWKKRSQIRVGSKDTIDNTQPYDINDMEKKQ